jgi:hypothetical protein
MMERAHTVTMARGAFSQFIFLHSLGAEKSALEFTLQLVWSSCAFGSFATSVASSSVCFLLTLDT